MKISQVKNKEITGQLGNFDVPADHRIEKKETKKKKNTKNNRCYLKTEKPVEPWDEGNNFL